MTSQKKTKVSLIKSIPILVLVSAILYTVNVFMVKRPEYHLAKAAAPLANITHESGSLGEYTSAATDGGDLAVSTSAGLAGTKYGLGVTIDDNSRIYAVKALPVISASGVMRARFYIDPNSLHLGELEQISFIFFSNSGGQNNFSQMKLMKLNGSYALRGVMIDDNEVHKETQPWFISDSPHYVEIRVKRASSATSSDATFETWIDGVSKQTMTGVDSYVKFSDLKYIGVGLINAGGTINGTYFIDEIAVNSDGTSIGPVSSYSPTPTVQVTPSPTPKVTPTPSPTPKLTATPTPAVIKQVEIVNSSVDNSRKYIVFDGLLENGQLTEVNASRFQYSGGWTTLVNNGVNGSQAKYSSTIGNKVSFGTSAQQIIIQTAKYSYVGKFDVFVNGVKKATFDGYSSTPQYATFTVTL